MKVYFGEVAPSDIDDEFEFFTYDGKYFDFCIEFTEDQVVIKDTCERVMPMSWDALHSLQIIMDKFSNHIEALATVYSTGGVLADEEDALIREV